MLVNLICNRYLSCCKRLKCFFVRFRHLCLDIVKEEGKSFTSKLSHLIEFSLQSRNLFTVRVGDVQTRRQGVVEVEVAGVSCTDQVLQMVRLLHCVELPPEGPVLTVVLRSVQVAGHAPRFHLLEQVSPLRQSPWPAVESLNNATEERSSRVGVRLLLLTRARHCRSVKKPLLVNQRKSELEWSTENTQE